MGDAELLALLFEMEVTMLRAEVAPPPNTRHLAVGTGKRYGKTSLTARHGRDLVRAIAECRYLLREVDPNGNLVESSRVGRSRIRTASGRWPRRSASRQTARVISGARAKASSCRTATSCWSSGRPLCARSRWHGWRERIITPIRR